MFKFFLFFFFLFFFLAKVDHTVALVWIFLFPLPKKQRLLH